MTVANDLDEKESTSLDLEQCLGVIRRHHIHFLIPVFLGWIAVWCLSWVLPPRYRSGTLILVEQPTMPKDYVTPNVNDDLQERLQSITQQILSRTRLLHIIDDKNLYPDNRSRLTPDEKVERMRKDIEIELVRDAQNRVDAFNVYYTAGDPHVAQQVTSQLTDLFINENLEVRQRQSEDTTKFLEGQLDAARETLSEQEQQIRQFKGQHVGELPSQLESNLQILSGLQSQMRAEEDALNTAKQQRVYLQSLVDQYRSLNVSAPTADGAPVGLAAIDRELERLKAQLADLSSHYTERHPDVRKLKDQIAQTQSRRDQFVVEMGSKGNGSSAENASQPSLLVQLQSQLQSNQVEINNRERAIAELKSKMSEYQGKLSEEPVREQQLADLTRGYDQSKANYDELLKKKNESAMATSMELLQQGERFRVIDPPSLPMKPDFPNRLKFCGIGVGIGFALGLVVVGGLELTDDRLHTEKQITSVIEVPVICEIPTIRTPADDRAQSKRTWRDWAVTAALMVAILLGSAFSYLRG